MTQTNLTRPQGLNRIDPVLREAAIELGIVEFRTETLPTEREHANLLAAQRDLAGCLPAGPNSNVVDFSFGGISGTPSCSNGRRHYLAGCSRVVYCEYLRTIVGSCLNPSFQEG